MTPDRNQLALDALETVSHYLNNMGAPNDVWDAFEVAQKHAATAPKNCDALVKALEETTTALYDILCASNGLDDNTWTRSDGHVYEATFPVKGYKKMLEDIDSVRMRANSTLAAHRAQHEGE